MHILGFDIGGTKTAAVLAEINDGIKIVGKKQIQTETAFGLENSLERIKKIGHGLLDENNVKIAAVGVSCGGPLDSVKGLILSPPNLPGWDNVPICEIFSGEFGADCFLQNDANACALAEWKFGAGKGADDVVFLTMGTGFGAGVISGGKLLTGPNDLFGEIGHLRLAKDGPVGFGKAGSIEGFCSGGGIARSMAAYTRAKEAIGIKTAWLKDGLQESDWDVLHLSKYAADGDADAIKIFEAAGEKLGEAVSMVIDAFNPHLVVIGSIFVRCEKFLRPAMEKTLASETIPLSLAACKVVPAACGESLGDYAAVTVAAEALGADCSNKSAEAFEHVLPVYESLFSRYPALATIRQPLADAFKVLYGCYSSGGKLLICGNGGSAADSTHIVGELMKGFLKKRNLSDKVKNDIDIAFDGRIENASHYFQRSLPAIDLTGAVSLSTAFLNDVHPEMVFAQQTFGYGKPGDVLLCISTSGNAKNAVNAALTAKALKLKTIALTGGNGGELGKICGVSIRVPGKNTPEIQEYHLPVYHTLCAMLEEAFF